MGRPEFESTEVFLWVGLPSIQIHHDNGLFKQQAIEGDGFAFLISVKRKHFEYRACTRNNTITYGR